MSKHSCHVFLYKQDILVLWWPLMNSLLHYNLKLACLFQFDLSFRHQHATFLMSAAPGPTHYISLAGTTGTPSTTFGFKMEAIRMLPTTLTTTFWVKPISQNYICSSTTKLYPLRNSRLTKIITFICSIFIFIFIFQGIWQV